MFGLGPMEMAIVGVIAILLFGKRLPEVGRSLGKGIVEFKKGLADIKSEVDAATNVSMNTPSRVTHRNEIDDYDEAPAPKFDPPRHEPQDASSHEASSHQATGEAPKV